MVRFTAFLLITFFCCTSFSLLAQSLPPKFYDEILSKGWNTPVGITFSKDGTGFVWEKAGRVYQLTPGGERLPNPLIDISEEVGDFGDHGLLGFALDPNFQQNGYIYLLYVVDRHHLLHFGTPDYDPDFSLPKEATIGRLTRYKTDPFTGFTEIIPESRTILMGKTVEDGFPVLALFHGIGSLVFGEDGTLLVSCGDGNARDISYHEQAIADGIMQEKENIGPFRALLLNHLNGKIIRIDPETGLGLPSNPFYDPNAPDAPRSKVWAFGLRNAYRFSVIPGTGEHDPGRGEPGVLFIGDVGEGQWEELNIATEGGQCFGWPMYEGHNSNWHFYSQLTPNFDAPNPFYGEPGCEQEFLHFQELIQQETANNEPTFPNPCQPNTPLPESSPTFVQKRPTLAWSNLLWNLPERAEVGIFDAEKQAKTIEIDQSDSPVAGHNFGGFSSIAGFFYQGDNFPEQYQNKYFHADLSGWIKTMSFDDNYHLLAVDSFQTREKGLASLVEHPVNGCIYYVDVYDGQVRRICYGGTPPPVVKIQVDTLFGESPLTVHFDASQTYHPAQAPMTFTWDLGDGTTASGDTLSHTFSTTQTNPTSFAVKLNVADTSGQEVQQEVVISLNNTPPKVEITSPNDGDFYALNGFTNLALQAKIEDSEHQSDELTYRWQTFLHHNTHYHAEPIDEAKATEILIDPLGCSDETYWYRIRLEVTDANGLMTADEVEIFPLCDNDFFTIESFTAFAKNASVQLDWQTSFEEEVQSFDIQRTDNIRFRTIGTVEANNQSSGSTYTFEDTQPERGTYHYRLKAVRMDGSYEYSDEVAVTYPTPPEFEVFPNPANELIHLRVKNVQSTEIQLQIYNAYGGLMTQQRWKVTPGDNWHERLLTRQLGWGTFFYRLIDGERTEEGKLIIAR